MTDPTPSKVCAYCGHESPPRLARVAPEALTLLDVYAAAIVIAKAGSSSTDIFDKAAALVAESDRRKGKP